MNVLIAGDFCPQNRVAELFNRGEYDLVLGKVRDITSKSDYSIVNLECPITKGGESPIVKQGPNLSCSKNGIDALKWAGFNCVTLANNHFYDYGEEGVENTLDECKEKGFDVVGGGRNIDEASAVIYKQIGSKIIAVINCCEHEFSISSKIHGGANPLNPIQQFYAIKSAKAKADYVLVIVHGGHEHWQLPSPRMKETYRFFIDAGADAVVNHHQHCFSGYEVYNNRPIFYGLGNFCFDRTGKWGTQWNEGLLIMLSFNDNNVEFKIYPYHQCKDDPTVDFLELGAFDKRLAEINAIIRDDDRLRSESSTYYTSSMDKMEEVFEPINGHYYLAGKRRGLFPSLISKKRFLLAKNLVCCESHRDKLMFFLNHHKCGK